MQDPAIPAIRKLGRDLNAAFAATRMEPEPMVPVPGMPATMCYPNDRYPATVVRVSDSGKTVWVRPDLFERLDDNFASEVQRYFYRPDPCAALVRFTLRASGSWVEADQPSNCGYRRLGLGWREAFLDPTL